MNIKPTAGERVFEWILYIFMAIVIFATLYPFWYLLSLSFTSSLVPSTEIHLIPPVFDFMPYKKALADSMMYKSFFNTVYRTLFGTVLTVAVTVLLAYPLSKKYLPNRVFWTGFIVFTMYFEGGMIPSYLQVKYLGILNSIWALTLPVLVNSFNLLIVRNFFMSIPESLEESARIDGASDYLILFRIILPLSMPIIATLILWTAVGHWNAWFDALIYITSDSKQVMQNIMRRIVMDNAGTGVAGTDDMSNLVNPENLKAATIMITTLPIILVYPFLQKYFVKGVLVGSVKG
jgi:putative aldouronate transport system permease protein